MDINIRSEQLSDYPAIKTINDRAFGQPNESRLVEDLRKNLLFIKELSLVADVESQTAGHILFFPIEIKNEDKKFNSLALAPMSVLPEYQKQGIGSALVRAGLEKAKGLGFVSVIVLGHAEYYPRFGFQRASVYNIKAPFEVPDNIFFALELRENGLRGVSGTVEYPPEFNEI